MRRHASDRLRFDLREVNGALGDLGTLLPLTIGAIALVGLSATQVLLGFGLFYIATGLIYRLPVPVQPMKAIVAVALMAEISPASIALSGMLIGSALLLLGGTGIIDRIARRVPQSVLTGLQLGLGLGLAWISLGLMAGQPLIGLLSLGLAAAALRLGTHAALMTLGFGVTAGHFVGHEALPDLAGAAAAGWLAPVPSLEDMRIAITDLALPQLALTLTNAVILTAIVAHDSYGARAARVTPKRLCLTSGIANLALSPFGALPMCHGAGGVAAHHRFGAQRRRAGDAGGRAAAGGAAAGRPAAHGTAGDPVRNAGGLVAGCRGRACRQSPAVRCQAVVQTRHRGHRPCDVSGQSSDRADPRNAGRGGSEGRSCPSVGPKSGPPAMTTPQRCALISRQPHPGKDRSFRKSIRTADFDWLYHHD